MSRRVLCLSGQGIMAGQYLIFTQGTASCCFLIYLKKDFEYIIL